MVIGNEWNFCCCTERREFSIVRIFDEDKVVEIDTPGKLSLWPKEITELIPTEERNSAQNKLGLAPDRFVPDQLKAPFQDSREDTPRCASRVEARGYEDIRVDDNPFHSDFTHRKLAKVSRKILFEQKPVHLSPHVQAARKPRAVPGELENPAQLLFPLGRSGSPAAPLSLIPAFCRADYDLSAEDQRSVGVGDRDGPEALFPPKNTGDDRVAVLILSAESTR